MFNFIILLIENVTRHFMKLLIKLNTRISMILLDINLHLPIIYNLFSNIILYYIYLLYYIFLLLICLFISLIFLNKKSIIFLLKELLTLIILILFISYFNLNFIIYFIVLNKLFIAFIYKRYYTKTENKRHIYYDYIHYLRNLVRAKMLSIMNLISKLKKE